MTTTEPALRIVAVGLLSRSDGDGHERLLVARRRPQDHLGGQLELPGGRVEEGEAPEEALARELSEELGLRIDGTFKATPITFSYHQYPERTVLLLFYSVLWRPEMGEPRALASDHVAWLTRGELIAAPMPEGNRPLIHALAAGWQAPDPTL